MFFFSQKVLYEWVSGVAGQPPNKPLRGTQRRAVGIDRVGGEPLHQKRKSEVFLFLFFFQHMTDYKRALCLETHDAFSVEKSCTMKGCVLFCFSVHFGQWRWWDFSPHPTTPPPWTGRQYFCWRHILNVYRPFKANNAHENPSCLLNLTLLEMMHVLLWMASNKRERE